MKNKMELLQAAQQHAAETVGLTDRLEIDTKKIEAFTALGIDKQHYPEFSTQVDGARTAYASLRQQPVKAATPATPAAA